MRDARSVPDGRDLGAPVTQAPSLACHSTPASAPRTLVEARWHERREMQNRFKATVVAMFALAAVGAVLPGGAGATPASKIVFSVQNVGDAGAACGGFGLSFDMVSPAGSLLGRGRSCIGSFEGCDPSVAFRPGCHATIGVTFVLDFADGSLTAPMTLREVYPDPVTVRQHGEGHVSDGSGGFAGARGVVEGGGTLVFAPFAVDLVYVVHLTGTQHESTA